MQTQDNICWIVLQPLSYLQLLAYKRRGYSDNRAYINGAAWLLSVATHLYQFSSYFPQAGLLKLAVLSVSLAAGGKMAVGGFARGTTGRVEMVNGGLLILAIGIYLSF